MKDALKQKLLLIQQEESKPEPQRNVPMLESLKRDALEEALVEIAQVGTCGMKAFRADLEWVSRLVEGELLNADIIASVKSILFSGNDTAYDHFVMEVAGRMQKAYSKYFRAQTQAGDVIYSPILNMFWNQKLQLWEHVDENGWHSYNAYMPYAVA